MINKKKECVHHFSLVEVIPIINYSPSANQSSSIASHSFYSRKAVLFCEKCGIIHESLY